MPTDGPPLNGNCAMFPRRKQSYGQTIPGPGFAADKTSKRTDNNDNINNHRQHRKQLNFQYSLPFVHVHSRPATRAEEQFFVCL